MRLALAFTLGLLAGVGLLAQLGTLHAQPATPTSNSRVLDLDGTNACVVLPSGIVTNDVMTVEGWFKWRRFNSMSRLFDFYGERVPFGIQNRGTTATLHFERPERDAAGQINRYVHVSAPALLTTNEWCHVAAVVRTNSTQLYFNGVLVATEEVRYGWTPPTEPDRTNYLGRSALVSERRAGNNPDFDGQMAELRLWSGERTEAQLRENMFKSLAGYEAGLAALWNFNQVENGVVKDATAGGHHGRLIGNARTVEAPRPSQSKLPALLSGKTADSRGNVVTNASIRLWRGDQEMATTRSRPDGTYSLALGPELAEGAFDI